MIVIVTWDSWIILKTSNFLPFSLTLGLQNWTAEDRKKPYMVFLQSLTVKFQSAYDHVFSGFCGLLLLQGSQHLHFKMHFGTPHGIPVSLNQCGYFPLILVLNKVFLLTQLPLTDIFLFFSQFCVR